MIFSARQKISIKLMKNKNAEFPGEINRIFTLTLSSIWPRLWAISSRCKSKAFRYVLIYTLWSGAKVCRDMNYMTLAAIERPYIFDRAESICIFSSFSCTSLHSTSGDRQVAHCPSSGLTTMIHKSWRTAKLRSAVIHPWSAMIKARW